MAIDYEAEYNNRARVPEHAAIFAQWVSEAAAYRAEMTKAGRAELGLPYGPSPRQIIDLFKPNDGNGPLAVFIHGGFWRSLDPSSFSHLARGMNASSLTVAMLGYDLSPQVSIGTIIEQTQQACLYLWRRFHRRIMVSGHSAGGHLTACMVATDWNKLDPSAPADLVPAGYAISGLFDLEPMIHISSNADYKLDAAEARRISPLFWPVPQHRTLDAVVGGAESSEFLRQSRIVADGWGEKGVETRYEAFSGKNHFTVLEPMLQADSAMTLRLAELAHRT